MFPGHEESSSRKGPGGSEETLRMGVRGPRGNRPQQNIHLEGSPEESVAPWRPSWQGVLNPGALQSGATPLILLILVGKGISSIIRPAAQSRPKQPQNPNIHNPDPSHAQKVGKTPTQKPQDNHQTMKTSLKQSRNTNLRKSPPSPRASQNMQRPKTARKHA